jgi:hypothetical protein
LSIAGVGSHSLAELWLVVATTLVQLDLPGVLSSLAQVYSVIPEAVAQTGPSSVCCTMTGGFVVFAAATAPLDVMRA